MNARQHAAIAGASLLVACAVGCGLAEGDSGGGGGALRIWSVSVDIDCGDCGVSSLVYQTCARSARDATDRAEVNCESEAVHCGIYPGGPQCSFDGCRGRIATAFETEESCEQ